MTTPQAFKQHVVKHSAAIQVTNVMTLLQRRAWNVMLANAYDNLLGDDIHSMRVADLVEYLGITTRNDDHIRQMLTELQDTTVEFNILGKDKAHRWERYKLLANIVIEGGTVHYSYGGILSKLLYNPTVYARIKLSIQNRFGSKYALALYELLIDHMGVGQTRWIHMEEFRKLMGLDPGQYEEFKYLNRYVVRNALEEINEVSDISGEVEYRKQSRRVVALKFLIRSKQLKLELSPAFTPAASPAGDGASVVAPVLPGMEEDAFDVYFAGLTPLEKVAIRSEAERIVDQQGGLPPRTREGMVQAEMRKLWSSREDT